MNLNDIEKAVISVLENEALSALTPGEHNDLFHGPEIDDLEQQGIQIVIEINQGEVFLMVDSDLGKKTVYHAPYGKVDPIRAAKAIREGIEDATANESENSFDPSEY